MSSVFGFLPGGVSEKLGVFAVSMLPDVGFLVSAVTFAPGYVNRQADKKQTSNSAGKMHSDFMSMRNFGVGFASYLVWKECGGLVEGLLPLASYGTLLTLYWSYHPVLFRFRSNQLSLAHSIATSISAAATTFLFWRVNQRAGILMIPFVAHLAFTAIRLWVSRDRKRIPSK